MIKNDGKEYRNMETNNETIREKIDYAHISSSITMMISTKVKINE